MKEENTHFIQDLIEDYNFNDLSAEHQQKVLANMTEAEYAAKRKTVLASVSLFAEADRIEPKPLILSEKPPFLLAPIPMYQVLIGLAAMLILMLLIFPIKQIKVTAPTTKYVTLYDTIETKTTVFDTIERIIEKPILTEKIVYVNLSSNSTETKEAPRLLNVPRYAPAISLTENNIQNRGTSMKDDTLLLNLPRIF